MNEASVVHGNPIARAIGQRKVRTSALIVDWGGTLVEYMETYATDYLLSAHKSMGVSGSSEDFVTACQQEITDFWSTLSNTMDSGRLEDVLRPAIERLYPGRSGQLIEPAIFGYIKRFAQRVKVQSGVHDALGRLRSMDLPMVLLSNTLLPGHEMRRINDEAGLSEYFLGQVYSSDIKKQKPDPSAFWAAISYIPKAKRQHVVAVGDRQWDDIAGARAAKIKSILIRMPWSEDPQCGTCIPDAEISSFARVDDVIEVMP